MDELFDLNKLTFEKQFKKPNLSIIDIDFNQEIDKSFDPETICLPIFKAVYLNNIETIRDYSKKNYIERNLNHQTPLMLAARLNKFEIIEILLNECCQIDDDDTIALDFAIKYSNNKKMINKLKEYELY